MFKVNNKEPFLVKEKVLFNCSFVSKFMKIKASIIEFIFNIANVLNTSSIANVQFQNVFEKWMLACRKILYETFSVTPVFLLCT